MKVTGKCPKCQSENIVKDAIAADFGGNRDYEASVIVYQYPDAMLRKHAKSSRVSAWVCGNCGLIEYYADDPKLLWDTFVNQNK